MTVMSGDSGSDPIRAEVSQKEARQRSSQAGNDPDSGQSTYNLLLDSGEQEYIDSRIRDVEKASARCRWGYIVLSLVSLVLISVAYNQLLSWSRTLADSVEDKRIAPGSWSDFLVGEQLKQWIGGVQFDLPYLGGQFGASDAGTVGGILLLVACLWCYYSVRRENHVVYFLVKDGHDFSFSDNARFYLRNQLYSTQLFIEGKHARPYGVSGVLREAKEGKSNAPIPAHYIIFYLPVVALSFVLMIDIWSLFTDSPMRTGDDWLLYVLCPPDISPLLSCQKFHSLLFRLFASLVLALIVLVISVLAKRYHDSTTSLVSFANEWKKPVLIHRRKRVAKPISKK